MTALSPSIERLVEHVVLIACKEKLPDAEKPPKFGVLAHFPETAKPAKGIEIFAMAHLSQFEDQPNNTPTHHSFVMTQEDGRHLYAFCLLKQEPIMTKQGVKYCPRVVCAVSGWPYHETFRKIFAAFSNLLPRNTSFDASTVRSMYELLSHAPFPSPTQTVTLRVGEKDITYSRPGNEDLPLADVDFKVLFSNLSPKNVINVFCSLIAEAPAIFVTSNAELLTPCMESVVTLLFPLQPIFVYITVLPAQLGDLIHAPTPYMYGMLKEHFVEDQIPDHVCIVDLDENRVRIPSFVPQLPTRFRSKLMRCITRHAPLYAVSNRGNMSDPYEMEDPDEQGKDVPNAFVTQKTLNVLYSSSESSASDADEDTQSDRYSSTSTASQCLTAECDTQFLPFEDVPVIHSPGGSTIEGAGSLTNKSPGGEGVSSTAAKSSPTPSTPTTTTTTTGSSQPSSQEHTTMSSGGLDNSTSTTTSMNAPLAVSVSVGSTTSASSPNISLSRSPVPTTRTTQRQHIPSELSASVVTTIIHATPEDENSLHTAGGEGRVSGEYHEDHLEVDSPEHVTYASSPMPISGVSEERESQRGDDSSVNSVRTDDDSTDEEEEDGSTPRSPHHHIGSPHNTKHHHNTPSSRRRHWRTPSSDASAEQEEGEDTEEKEEKEEGEGEHKDVSHRKSTPASPLRRLTPATSHEEQQDGQEEGEDNEKDEGQGEKKENKRFSKTSSDYFASSEGEKSDENNTQEPVASAKPPRSPAPPVPVSPALSASDDPMAEKRKRRATITAATMGGARKVSFGVEPEVEVLPTPAVIDEAPSTASEKPSSQLSSQLNRVSEVIPHSHHIASTPIMHTASLRKVFCGVFVSLLKSYREFLVIPKNMDEVNTEILDNQAMLASVSDDCTEFMKAIMDTQMFSYFVQDRVTHQYDIFDKRVFEKLQRADEKLRLFAARSLKGTFLKQGRIIKNWKERKFELKDLELKYFDPKSNESRGSVTIVPGDSSVAIPHLVKCPTPYPLELRTPGRKFLLCAKTSQDRRELLKLLKAKAQGGLDKLGARVEEGTALYQSIVSKMKGAQDGIGEVIRATRIDTQEPSES